MTRQSSNPIARTPERRRGPFGAAFLLGLLACASLSLTWPWAGRQEEKKPEPSSAAEMEQPEIEQKVAEKAQAVPGAPKEEVTTRDYEKNKAFFRDTSALQAQQQIQEILALNENLKRQYREQAVQIQKITEQARIHRQILADLERARSVRAINVPSDRSELLRQEKIRLIREETDTHYQYVKKLKNAGQA